MRIHLPPLLAVALVSLLAVACTRRSAGYLVPPQLYARGPIESITHHATASHLMVRGASPDQCGISATVDAQTTYFARPAGEAAREIQRSELAVGDTVEVYVLGPLTRSCPPQGRAATIIRTSAASQPGTP
jgi:hypothetical protein